MRNLFAGELIVRSALKQRPELDKEASAADILRGAGRFARGTGRVVQDTSSALGQSLEREVGGKLGKGLRTAAEVAPTAGVLGLGAYGAETALGNPVQNWLAQRKQMVGQKLRGGAQPAVYNPSTGVWY